MAAGAGSAPVPHFSFLVLRVNLQAAAFDAAQINALRPMVGDYKGRVRNGFRVEAKDPNKKDCGEKKQDDERRRNFGHVPAPHVEQISAVRMSPLHDGCMPARRVIAIRGNRQSA